MSSFCSLMAITLALVMSGLSDADGPARVATASEIQAAGGATQDIGGSREVTDLIRRVQNALGGQRRLLGVRSLLIDARRVMPDGREDPYTYRVLLPDRYQELRGRLIFTLEGPSFWQSPSRSEKTNELARTNTLSWFAEMCTALLLRAPSQMPISATLDRCDTDQVLCLALVGPSGFNRTLEIDARSYLPRGFSQRAQASLGDGAQTTVLRQVKMDAFQQIEGIRFPVKMTESWGGTVARIEYRSIRVNQGVDASDFERR
jgi:hypothetical protein